MPKNFLQRGWAALKSFVFPGTGGYSGNGTGGTWGDLFRMLLPGSQIDYKREAGNLWQNSIVLAAINWISRAANDAPLCVRQWKDDETGERIPNHPLSKLFRRPNPHYTGREMRYAINLSLLCDGNAYLFKIRSAAGKVVALYYCPHFLLEPRWPKDGSEFISFYEYRVNGKSYRVEVQDVVHFRHGLDPLNTRKGLGPISAALREVVSTNQANGYTAALMMNSGIVSLILAPKGDQITLDEEDADKIKRDFKAKFTGDSRGDIMIMETPMEMHKPGYSPQELALETILDRPEANILAGIGVSAMVLGINVGNKQKTYNNYGEAQESAWDTCILPSLSDQADQLDRQMLSELGDVDREECYFNTQNIRALLPDKNGIWKRAADAYAKGAIKRSEAKIEMGLDADDDDDIYITDLAPTPVEGTAENTEPDEDEKPAPKDRKKSMPGVLARWKARADVQAP